MHNLLTVNDKKKVLLLSGPQDRAWLCSGFDCPAETCNFDTALTERWTRRADFVLFDPHQNPHKTQDLDEIIFCNKTFLISMSPDPMNCEKIVKDARDVKSIYMGPTTMEESESMRICCYRSKVTAEQLQHRFALVGGIPRFLFKIAGVLSAERNIDAAVAVIERNQNAALNDLVENPRRIDAGNVAFNSLWSLYQLVPEEGYIDYRIELCSANGRKLLLHRLLKMKIQKLWDIFVSTENKYGTLRGIRFEAYAHQKILIDGIDRTACLLTKSGISSNKTKRVEIRRGSTLVELPDKNLDSLSRFATAVDTSFPRGRYLIPSLCNFPMIDSAYVGPPTSPELRIMFQMKAGKTKPLSKKVDKICNVLGNFFVVVVPADNVITQELVGGPPSMEQYVLVLNETTDM